MQHIKTLFFGLTLGAALLTEGCTVNPATGQQQFAALMPPAQENSVGASEHEKIKAQYGFIEDARLSAYVNQVGQSVTKDTERPDVQYKFFVLDSPIINAFALPGGYIYVSRGLLALANNEAELAAVLSHETGHITARHSAERYSRGVVTSLGAGLLGAAIGNSGATEALNLGSNLYLSSYSRTQETQADSLGLRYMTRGGYEADAMTSFLYSMQRDSELEGKISGASANAASSYFSTHPPTADRVNATRAEVGNYAQGGAVNKDAYLRMIDGLVYGDSADQGFVRGQSFYHPSIGFTFTAPSGFTISNQPSQVVAMNESSGAALIFDMVSASGSDPLSYVQNWVSGANVTNLERITVNGMSAATGSVSGQLNGKAVTIQLVAIAYGGKFARFQFAIPQGSGASISEGFKTTTYSFRAMSDQEKSAIRPQRISVFTAGSGDTVASRAAAMPFSSYKEERFRVLNGLSASDALQAGTMYKTIVQ